MNQNSGLQKGIMCMLGLVSMLATADAGEYRFRIKVDEDSSKAKEKVQSNEYGKGEETVIRKEFKAIIFNEGFDDLKDLGFRIYILASPHDFKADSSWSIVRKFQEKASELKSGQELKLELGEVAFKSTQTATGNTIWRSGEVYEGWVAEVLVGDTVVDTLSKNKECLRRFKEISSKNASGEASKKPK